MTLKFIPSQSTVMPKLLDTGSSQTHVFIRQNVEEKTRQDEHSGGEPQTYYEYEECQLTKQEYQEYLNDQLRAENADLKVQLQEQAEAMVELAGLIEEVNSKTVEHDDALIELVSMMG